MSKLYPRGELKSILNQLVCDHDEPFYGRIRESIFEGCKVEAMRGKRKASFYFYSYAADVVEVAYREEENMEVEVDLNIPYDNYKCLDPEYYPHNECELDIKVTRLTLSW